MDIFLKTKQRKLALRRESRSLTSWKFWNRAMLLSLAIAPTLLSAQIVSNLAESTDGTRLVGNPFGSQDRRTATTFTTGSNAGGYTLTSATIAFGVATLGTPQNIVVSITEDNSGEPGTVVGTLAGSNPTTAGNYDYTNDGLALAANTTYFLELSAPGSASGNRYHPAGATSNSETSSDGWTIGDGFLETTTGGTPWAGPFDGSLQFSLTATPVPEPHEYAMLVGLALVGFVAVRRRFHLVANV